ncbi:VCBS domain-containing protein [Bradyrhizobium manausense]|uniref:VCBS domain-containing protein n=1 Tax=Bradyrhizobium manausense TaxID=989370 RepID=UPI001BAA8677|nr:VCBS domain-containing protein [Bradyrhizobium manausense]MBR0830454.1 VCBS domain-containing protein [Bradyrhizobium manausense]
MIINGTNGNDQIAGTNSADVINAMNGGDNVNAGAGNDLVLGGNGNDTIDGGAGNDIILGGNGNDTLLGGAGNDLIGGGNGDDIIDGGAGSDILSGENGNDILIYRVSDNVGSADIYDGGKGQDTLRLVVTQAFANSASFKSDIQGIQALIARYGSADYAFRSFNLAVVSIEKVEIVIEGATNHAPVAVADLASVAEDATSVASGNLLANDTDADAGDTHTVSAVAGGTDNGTTITVVTAYGTLVVTKATGAYTYTLNNSSASVQALAAGQQVTDQFTYTNADNNGGTGSSTLKVTITGSNDPAAITVSGSQDTAVTEAGGVANAVGGDPSASGQLVVHDVDTGQNHFATPASLAGTYGNFTFDPTSGAWTYTLDPAKSDSLIAGQNVTDTLTVASADGSATHDIVVNITGVNDAAAIGNPAQHDVTEDGNLTASGTLSINDVDQNQNSFQTGIVSAPGNLGTLTITAGGAYSYSVDNGLVQYLGDGETRNETFTIKAKDGTTKDVTFTIHGVNDAADIADPAQHDVTEDGNMAASGALSINDADQNQNSFQTGVVSAPGNLGTLTITAGGAYTYSVDNSLVQYLGAGETRNETFTVKAKDGTTKDVTFTIHGVNDAATIGDPVQHDVTEDGSLTASGVLSINDPDQNQSAFQTTVQPANGTLGSLTLAADGHYAYSVDNAATQYLSATDTKVETFTVKSVDGTSKDISFTIHGAQDAPSLSVVDHTSGASDTLIPLSISAALIDTSSTLLVKITGLPSGFTLNYGAAIDEGVWGLSAADLQHSDLALIPDPAVLPGLLTLHVSAISNDGVHQASSPVTDISVDVLASATVPVITGQEIDGYIAGATVFADANYNGQFDAGEAHTTTNADGSFALVGGSGTLVSIGGTDVSTGLAVTGVLKAPAGSTVITPLTTLIAAMVDSTAHDPTPLSAAAAENAIKTAFGLDPTIDLKTFDPVAAVVNGTDANDIAAATAVLSAAIQVQSTVAQVSAVVGSPDSVISAIADVIIATPASAIDLSATSTVTSVITGSTTDTVDQATLDAVTSVVTTSNDTIQSATTLTGLAQAGQVAQGASTDQLANTHFDNPTEVAALQTFVGTIETQVQNAVVGDVDGAQLGTLGDDVLTGGNGSDSIDGLDGNDHIGGGAGNDFLYGGAGKDYLTGGAGDDLLDGGQGFDRAIYTDATGGITANLAAGTVSGPGVDTDTLVNIEAVVGSNFADTLDAREFTGDSNVPGTPIGFNEFEGKGGDDVIYSNSNSQGAELTRVSYVSATGAVTVDLAAGTADGDLSVGHDTLIGSGFIGAWGSAFDDVLKGTNNPNFSAEVFSGFAGNDLIDGRGGFDRVDYNVDPSTTSGITVNMAAGIVTGDSSIGTDTLRGVEAVRGTNFADTYNATGFGAGSVNAGSLGTFNEFTGNGGDDIITGNGFTRLGFNNATAGVTVNFTTGIATGDSSVGTDHFTGVNAVQASMFNDTLIGGNTNDTFTGLAGDDSIDGGNGFDVSSYNNIFFTTGGITVNMAGGTVDGDASSGHDTLRSIEGVQGTSFADTYNATMYGVTGPNFGNNGTFNQFEGLGGDDTIIGNGNTRLLYGNSTAGVTINLVTGSATGDASAGHDTFSGVNSATGSNFVDTYNAAGFNSPNGTFNSFQGQGGNDVITGNGNTQVQFNNATGGVTVNLAAGTASGDASVGHDAFSGVNSASGSNFADVYDATGFNGLNGTFNSFSGNGGNDVITGNGNTQIQYGSATNSVTVNLTAGTADGDASVGHDTITGGVFNVAGSNFNDTIIGSASNDGLSGSGGNDVLDGRAGSDFLSGGLGGDTFVYATGYGFDTVGDFNHSQGDKIDLTGIYGIYSLADLQSHLTQMGPNTVISFGPGDTLTLQNVFSGNLVPGDFVFGTIGQTIVGDNSPNTLLGTVNADTISGLDGNDRLQGLGGSDLLDGGQGFDRAIYSDATGGITVNLTAGTVFGPGVGTDMLVNVEGIVGSNFADAFNATGFTGASGIPGAAVGLAEFEGGAGNDAITGSVNASGQILGRISYVSATAAVTVDLAAGTADGDASVGHDTFTNVNAIVGSAYDDTLRGTDNANGTYEQYDARGGNDLIDGRGGYDFASYNQDSATISGITVNLAAGTVTGDASIGTDTLRSVEAVRGTNFVDSYDATGFSGASINAGSFNTFNNFEGMGGDDTITGNGNTRLQFTQALDGVTVDIAAGTSHGTAGGDVAQVGTDTFTGVNAVLGSLFADTLSGSGANEQFQALAGNDFIDGRGGFDTAQYSNLTYTTGGISVDMASGTVTGDASTGTDTLRSIEGVQGTIFADTYVATGFGSGSTNAGSNGTFNQFEGQGGDDVITGNGSTRLLYGNATGGVTINLKAGSATGDGSVGHDTFTGVNSATGSNFADAYDATGFVGFNSFQGQGGDDVITGNGITQIFFNNATAGVTVDLAFGAVSGDSSVGHDTINGGVNAVVGSGFNDVIRGGKLTDALTGGAGADTFAYVTGSGADLITDFSQAQGDKIDLTGIAGANGVYSLADVVAHAQQVGGNTVITFSATDILTLQGVTLGNLTAADFIFGTQGTTITGDANNNTLPPGTANSDTVLGLAGNDRLQGGGGADLLDGGANFDRAVYTDATGAITVNMAGGWVTGAGVGTDTLVGIEGVVGSNFADTYNSSGFAGDALTPGTPIGFNEFEGKGGNDVIISNVNASGAPITRVSYVSATAAVTVDFAAKTATGDASVGTDTFVGSGVANVNGSAFNDTLLGSSNPFGTVEVFDGRAGDDFIDGRGGFDRVDYINDTAVTAAISVNLAAGIVTGNATVGTDTLRSVEGVRGTAFNDTYDATGFSASSVNAGSNGTFNEFTGGGGDDLITGNGNTRLSYNNATAGITIDLQTGLATSADGSVGTDHFSGVNAVQGSMYDDTMSGASTNDSFIGNAGNDFIDGRGNFDTVNYNNIYFVTGGINVDLAAGTVTGDASIGTDTLRSIEGIQGTTFADTFNATGYGGLNALNVSDSNGNFNQFEGFGGDDVVTGNGNTRIQFTNATAGVTINITAGTASGDASVGHDTLSGVNSANGSNFGDVYDATGFIGPNFSFNSFQGQGGDDLITGNGNTQIFFNNATAAVVVDLSAGTASGDASVGHDTITGGVNSVAGSNFNDTIVGSNVSNDFLSGNAGNDYLNGNLGNDFLSGGAGSDLFVYSGLSNADVINDFNHAQGDMIEIAGVAGIASFADVLSHAAQVGINTVITFDAVNSLTLNNVTLASLTAADFVFASGNNGVVLNGDNGDNLALAGGAGQDTILGNDGTDQLFGSDGDDVLLGGNGQDFLSGGAGNDYLNGGANVQGNGDMANYGDAPTGVVVNLGTGVASDGYGGTDTLVNIEGVGGSTHDDVLTGSAADNEIFDGGMGNDIIDGGGKSIASTPFGDFSNYAGAMGGVVVNLVTGTAVGDLSVGTDTLINIDSINGTAFDDVITGNANANLLRGFAGSDVIHGGDGNDQIEGGQLSNPSLGGNDVLYGEGGNDVIYGGSGNDLIDGGIGNDILTGLAGADTFVFAVHDGADQITDFSHAQGDRIDLTGVAGAIGSIADIQSHAQQVGADTVITFGGGDTLTLTNVTLGGLVDGDFIFATLGVTQTGDANANTLSGTANADTLIGLGGNDKLQGFAGYDLLDGGQGLDRAVYSDATGGITVSLATGSVTGAGVGTDMLVNVEAITGSNFADTFDATGFTGDAGIAGTQLGFDEFEGLGGNDTIITGTNASGAPLTRISYASATAGVTVDLMAKTATGDASVGTDTIVGSGVGNVIGSAFVDTLLGSSNPFGTVEIFDGRGGNDIINGRGGFDRADYANDPTITSAGISVNLAAGTVTVNTTTGTDTDTLISVESVRGSNSNDTFTAAGFSGSGVNPGSNGTFNEFNGMGGTDVITGNGNTRVAYTNATGAVVVDLQTGATPGTGTADGDSSTGHDTFTGVNAIQASVFSDTLRGSANNDTFTGNAGDDSIDGRGGFDTASYNNIYFVTGGVTVNLAAGTATGDASIGNDTLRSIEGIQGTVFADNFNAVGFSGTSTNAGNNGTFNQFEGLGGDDVITGNGNTRIQFTNATAGVTINLQAGSATGDASVGHDTFTGVNSANGSNFVDTYNATGFAGFNVFQGQGGNDVITGNGSTQIFFNNATGSVNINLVAGTATGDSSVGTDTFTGVNSAVGSNGSDTYDATGFMGLFGTFNAFQGLAGDDTIIGNGFTQIQYGNATGGVTIDLAAGTAVGNIASVGTDHFSGVNNVAGSNFGDTINGTSANEFFNGAGGNDIINAGDGYDQITGSSGNDTIDGGAGGDVAVFSGQYSDYTISTLVGGQIQVVDNFVGGRDGTDVLSNIELLQFTDKIVMTSSGTSGAPVDISGLFLNGNAPIVGTAGDDYLAVGSNLFGHTIDLGAGTNTVSLNGSGGFYGLNLVNVANLVGDGGDNNVGLSTLVNGLSVDLGGGANMLNLASGTNSLSVSNVSFINGSDFGGINPVDDVLTLLNDQNGTSINLGDGTHNTLNLEGTTNVFSNLWGVQVINGSGGNDMLTVNSTLSNTTVDLGAGTDALVMNGIFNSVTVNNVENVTGSIMNDTIVIANATGTTTVTGGGGMDMMTASAGVDNFRYASVSDSYVAMSDTIDGFNAAQDFFVFDNSMVGAGGFTGSSVNFVDSDPFTSTGQSQARLDNSGGQTMLQIDVNGDGNMDGSDIQIHLTNNVGTITNGNFLFV